MSPPPRRAHRGVVGENINKSDDGWVRLDDVYREFAARRERHPEKETHSLESNDMEFTPLAEFLVQVAQCVSIDNPDAPDYMISFGKSAESQLQQASLIPDLDDLKADETPVLRVNVSGDERD
jgi:hypothetical protein